MEFTLMLVVLVALGGGIAVTLTLIDKIFNSRRRTLETELLLEKERRRARELRIAEIERENEKLQRQIEWYQRLLENETSDHGRTALGPGVGR
jgi:hypothetical protein